MRLLDQVAQAHQPVWIEDARGRHKLVGAADRAHAVADCPLRFVLDDRVSERCYALLSTDSDMLVGENDLLRVTAPLFWMEWSDTSQGKNARRVGLLVNADESGRSGHIETFWEQDEGEPVYAQAIIEFDLNHEINLREPRVAFSIENSAHSLAPHVLFHVEDKWRDHFFYKGEEVGTKTVGTIVNSLLVGIEILFCFSVLLAERAGLQSHVINLSRLNAARTKKGRPPLLDHVEARIDLNIAIGLTGASSAFGSTRETARLHHVRGHMVYRDGRSFWRRSHLRGDPSKPVATQTITVLSRPRS